MIPGSASAHFFGAAGSSSGYEIERSLRFNSADSAYLSRTPASAGNRKTWTWAGWVKFSKYVTNPRIFESFGSYLGSPGRGGIYLDSSTSQLVYYDYPGSFTAEVRSTQVFRDFSAWYHIIVSVDTTEASSANRVKFYVNGVSAATSGTYPSLNLNTTINLSQPHYIGALDPTNGFYLDGYLADIHFIDGQALDPTSFGEFDTNGVWQPKAFSGGSYGTNGFHLDFSDNSTAAALGTDTSGNGNHWTVSNLVASAVEPPYSSFVTLSNSYEGSPGNLFDGNLSTVLRNLSNTQWITVDLTRGGASSGVAFSTSFELYGVFEYAQNLEIVHAGGTYVYNGAFSASGSWINFAANLTSPVTSFRFKWSGGTGTPRYAAVRVDGSIIIDNNPENDSLVDTPTNYGEDTGAGGEVRGNYATFTAVDNAVLTALLSNGNLNATGSGSGQRTARGTLGVTSGQYYFEYTIDTLANIGNQIHLGFGSLADAPSGGFTIYLRQNGTANFTPTSGSLFGFTTGDIISFAVDFTNSTFVCEKNGGSTLTASFTPTSSPLSFRLLTGDIGQVTVNAGQRPFAYTAPSGFKALCTQNLPTPTIADGSTVMDVVLDTGANILTAAQGAIGGSADLLWIKDRANVNNHQLIDTVRGGTATLQSNTSDVETTYSAPSGSSVAWTWDAGSSTVTNNDGTITSQVRANPSAGFSIVSWTGTGSNGSVGHGLGAVPKMYIMKKRNVTSQWVIYLTDIISPQQSYLTFTTAAAAAGGAAMPTSSILNVLSSYGSVNTHQLVAYCFAPVSGYSAFGSYTGNGSTDGPFVYTGFRPRWVMVKGSDVVGGQWFIVDASRSPYNVTANYIQAESSSAEGTTSALWDFCSNGFKLRGSGVGINGSGNTYIYAAFAEHPFACSRAR